MFGVGLIGGSLALSFKKQPHIHVVGHSYNPQSVQKYLQHEVVDSATTSMEEAALDADVIFLCVPVGSLEAYLHELHKLPLKAGCIITDVGSTKMTIMKCASKLQWKDVYFIGGHPMAGSERSGVEAATADLYENAIYVLTPEVNVPEGVYERLADLLRFTRAQIIRMKAAKHDEIVGAISHLPHIIAAALVNQVSEYSASSDLYERLAAGGFRDITRIASSDPVIWRDILLNNQDVLLNQLEDWNQQISKFIHLLRQQDGAGIEKLFQSASEFRNKLPERKKGVILSAYDVYVDIPDHPGIIGQITSQLGTEQINLSNIQIFESRVDVPGVLRLTFRNEKDMERAIAVLKAAEYSVHL